MSLKYRWNHSIAYKARGLPWKMVTYTMANTPCQHVSKPKNTLKSIFIVVSKGYNCRLYKQIDLLKGRCSHPEK